MAENEKNYNTPWNPEHLEVVKAGAEAIAEWRRQNPAQSFQLRNAKMSSAGLSNIDLRHANLSDANLSDSDLRAADLSYADLSNADLSDAYLRNAKFNSSIMKNAKLNGTRMWGTSFADVDLSEAIGLDRVMHEGPCTIGIDTLFRSSGKIPEVFLRGCGVPEILLTYLPSLIETSIDYYSCFISYGHEDKLFAKRLYDSLQARGIRCWLDEKQTRFGDDLYDEIERGIKLWDKVILCASKDSLTSWWVDAEIDKAFEKERQLRKQREKDPPEKHRKKPLALIPLDLDGYMFEGWESGMSSIVKRRVVGDFTDWKTDHDKFEDQVEAVVKALRTDELPHEKPPPTKLK